MPRKGEIMGQFLDDDRNIAEIINKLSHHIYRGYDYREELGDPRSIVGLINDLANQINLDNRKKGFWDEPRDVGCLLMLIVSEVSEALEAKRKGKKDDHILGRDGFEVELADTAIRIFDMAGGMRLDIGGEFILKCLDDALPYVDSDDVGCLLMHVVRELGRALDSWNMLLEEREQITDLTHYLTKALMTIHFIAGKYGLDLGGALVEKLIYNKARPYKHGKLF